MANFLKWLLGNESVDTYHAYAWDTRQDAGWGMQGSGVTGTNAATDRSPEEGPSKDLCWPVEGSDGSEDEIMQSVYEETYWGEKWPWWPWLTGTPASNGPGLEDQGVPQLHHVHSAAGSLGSIASQAGPATLFASVLFLHRAGTP